MKSFTIVRGVLLTALLVSGATTFTQGQGVSVEYRRAGQFLGDEIKKLVFDGTVTPRWIGAGSRFWY